MHTNTSINSVTEIMRSTQPSQPLLLFLLFFLLASIEALSLSTSLPTPTSTARPARRFYVLRHGQTNHNAANILQGSSDVSRLTAKGRDQAATIGSTVFGDAGTRNIASPVYVSPLTRAQETLSIVRQSVPPGCSTLTNKEEAADTTEIRILPNLREIDLYSWENCRKDDIATAHPREYAAWKRGDPYSFIVDGRQPLWETWDRASEVWREVRSEVMSMESTCASIGNAGDIEEKEEATLLVCHGTLGQALLATAFGLDATFFRRNTFPNCGMAEILWHDDAERAVAWRWHYPEPTELGCLREQLLGASVDGELSFGATSDRSSIVQDVIVQ